MSKNIENPGVLLVKIGSEWKTIRHTYTPKKTKVEIMECDFFPPPRSEKIIRQTGDLIGGKLLGVGNMGTSGQTVFSIGWKYVFQSTNTSQLYGTLIRVDENTGAPLEVIHLNKNIFADLPKTNSYNSGNSMISTTVDGVQYMYIRYDNDREVYRGIWDESLLQFKNFTVFSTASEDLGAGSYNYMVRSDSNTVRIITTQRKIYEFDIRTGEEIRVVPTMLGSWSPSSYGFANAYVPLEDRSMIIGASGSGNNFYVVSKNINPMSFNPTYENPYVDGLYLIGLAPHLVHPSTHHNVSYYTPNDNSIVAYRNVGVYIQERGGKTNGTDNSNQ